MFCLRPFNFDTLAVRVYELASDERLGEASTAALLIVLVVILLGVHLLVLLGAGRLFGFTLPELVTASNAAVLGATTAPALAAAKGWHDLVTPGVLVGVLGYALGTLTGTAIFHLWGLL